MSVELAVLIIFVAGLLAGLVVLIKLDARERRLRQATVDNLKRRADDLNRGIDQYEIDVDRLEKSLVDARKRFFSV